MSVHKNFTQLLTEYANLSFDAGRWSVDQKTKARYERAKERAGHIRSRLVTQHMRALLKEDE